MLKRVLFFQKICELIIWAKREYDINVLPFCYYRTKEQQLIEFNELRSKRTHSLHQDWLAMDLVYVVESTLVWEHNSAYILLGDKWKDMGGIWGGDWESLNDIYHFEWCDDMASKF